MIHAECGQLWHDHGWIDKGITGVTLCPGQFSDFDDSVASLAVLNPEGMFFNKNVMPSISQEGGTWHQPEDCG